MAAQRDGKRMWFTVAEAADILGMKRQAVYAAINGGRLKADKRPYRTRVWAEDVISYGIRAGRDPQELVKRVQETAEVDWRDVVVWVLTGLGLFWLISELFRKE